MKNFNINISWNGKNLIDNETGVAFGTKPTAENLKNYVANQLAMIKESEINDNLTKDIKAAYGTHGTLKAKDALDLADIVKRTLAIYGRHANLNFIDTSNVNYFGYLFNGYQPIGCDPDYSEWDMSHTSDRPVIRSIFY